MAASLVTILLNAALVRFTPAALARVGLARRASPLSEEVAQAEAMRDHVVICGYGRVGSGIGSAFETFGVRYSVVEIDPDVVGTLRARGMMSIFGDCAQSHVLERAGTHDASLLIMTVPDRDRAQLAIMNARRMNPSLPIIARAHRREDYEVLSRAGATEVIQPEMEASATMIRHACGHYLMVPDSQIRTYLRTFRDAVDSIQREPAMPPQSVPEVREVTLSNSAFAGRSIRDMKLRETFGVTVVAIRRTPGRSLVNPPADTVLQPNDRLRVLGRSEEIDAFAAQIAV